MSGFVIVGLSLSLIVMIISLIGPILGPSVEPVLGITVDATPLTLYFFIFSTIYNAILLSILALYGRGHSFEGEAEEHVFSLMIPCRNEEAVIEQTVSALMKVDYASHQFEVLVINDGSTDGTREVVNRLTREFRNLRLLEVPLEDSGRGKSAAMNKGFDHLLRVSSFRDSPDWIIGVFDSDGVADLDILKKVSYRFKDQKIGAVQTLVRISNAKQSILPMLQDIEFLTFAKVTQIARTIFRGAVALGGNGQFTRVSALRSVVLSTGEYWRNDALTEDLDLGTRILLKGWENSFLSTAAVYQYGVTTLSALYKQRTRWSWGSLQCFISYVASFKILSSNMRPAKKLDLLYYLSFTILPPVVLSVWALSVLGMLGLFLLYNPFPAYFMIANSISFFPLIGYGLWSVRREYKARFIIPLLFLTTAYTYHWVICTLRAMVHMIKRDEPRWIVTKKAQANPKGATEPIIRG